jgi:predicted DNA-binding ribbon-helix-helix protein
MSAGVVKRSVAVAGHRTSISLEEPFWDALREIAGRRGLSVQALIGEIDAGREVQNLSSAIRVFVLETFRGAGAGQAAREPTRPAGPGSAAPA